MNDLQDHKGETFVTAKRVKSEQRSCAEKSR